MLRKAAKPKRAFMDHKKFYDPNVEDRGNPREWKQAFNVRMGLDEAAERMRGNDPRAVLGVSATALWAEVKSAFRKLSMEFHPDRTVITGLDPAVAEEKFKQITAAYTLLEKEYGQA